MSDSWQPHGLQHARRPCPLPSLRVWSNSCPLSQWCYLTISSSANPPTFDFNLSHYRGFFQWVGSLYQALWSFSFSNSSFNEYSGSLSFQIDWFGLLAVHASLTALALGLCYTAVVNQREHPRHQGWVEMVHQLSPSLWLWDCTGHENSQSFHFFIWNNNSSLLKYRNEVRNQWRPSFYETECLWNNAAMKSKWLVLLTSPSVNWRVALWIMKDMLWEK